LSLNVHLLCASRPHRKYHPAPGAPGAAGTGPSAGLPGESGGRGPTVVRRQGEGRSGLSWGSPPPPPPDDLTQTPARRLGVLAFSSSGFARPDEPPA
jgi:hypothetical protein